MTRRVAGRYLLGEQLGAGGTSRVHAAVDERLGRRVAVKLLDARLVASADPAGRERFLREGPMSASFSHRHAVTVFDAGEDNDDLYIVMELVDGPSLAEHMAATGPLPIDEAVNIARQLLAALAAAHAAGIVHRDVKPANVLMGADGEIKLADFGIAKRFDELDDSVTTTGMVIGTPRYLAPEQATGAELTPATDVYAMGILLFEMFTGCTPFVGDTPIAIALVQQSQVAPDVRSLRPELSPRLAAAVARALATRPSDRYPTALEMAADLENAWPPPAAALPAAVVATQLMEAAGTPAVGARSGDTEIWPVAAAGQASTPVAMVPARRFPLKSVAIIAAVVVLAGIVAATLLGPDSSGRLAVDGSGVATTALPAVTESSVLASAPTTAPLVDEIIPGFARTDDLQVFLQQLDGEPTLVGESGEELAGILREVLDESSPRKQREGAKDLRKRLSEWVEDGELNPAIAAALDGLLAPLADGPGK